MTSTYSASCTVRDEPQFFEQIRVTVVELLFGKLWSDSSSGYERERTFVYSVNLNPVHIGDLSFNMSFIDRGGTLLVAGNLVSWDQGAISRGDEFLQPYSHLLGILDLKLVIWGKIQGAVESMKVCPFKLTHNFGRLENWWQITDTVEADKHTIKFF